MARVEPRLAPEWWASFFDQETLELWRRAHPREVTRAQAADIAGALGLRTGERVLDVPCGDGRHALELAGRGLRVTGLDLSGAFVRAGLEEARSRGLAPELVEGDMRALPWRACFDAAYCLGNSFGFFGREGELAFLRSVATALVPGGRFLLEYPMVAELLEASSEHRDRLELGDRTLTCEGRLDASGTRLEARYTITRRPPTDGERVEDVAPLVRVASYAVYRATEVEQLLLRAGFARVRLLEDPDGAAFGPGARAFYAYAER